MSAATVNRTGFKMFQQIPPVGSQPLLYSLDVLAAQVDNASDRVNIDTIDEGRTIDLLTIFDNEDGDAHATPTLDADIVLVQAVNDPSEAGTETILYNAGTRWQAASTTVVWVWCNSFLSEKGYNGKAYLRWLVNTAAATTVSTFNVRFIAWVH